MKIDDRINEQLKKINSGQMNEFFTSIDGSDFGLYIPAYVDGETVKPLEDGYGQIESNLKITVAKTADAPLEDTKVVAWMGDRADKPTQCRGGHNACMGHCPDHPGPIKKLHCA